MKKVILLDIGNGTKLYPLIKGINKLILTYMREILMIINASFINLSINFIGNGNELLKDIKYLINEKLKGSTQSLLLANYLIINKPFPLFFKIAKARLDTGTLDYLQDYSNFIEILQSRQKVLKHFLEKISWRKGFITSDQLDTLDDIYKKSNYGRYFFSILIRKDY